MNTDHFLDKSEIDNWDEILKNLEAESNFCNWFENVSNIIGTLKKNDPTFKDDKLKLKKASFTLINEIVCIKKWYRPWYEASFIPGIANNQPKDCKEMFEYLDKYWDIDAEGEGSPDRGYLIFFISYKSHKYSDFFPNG